MTIFCIQKKRFKTTETIRTKELQLLYLMFLRLPYPKSLHRITGSLKNGSVLKMALRMTLFYRFHWLMYCCAITIWLSWATLQMFVDNVRGSKKIPRAMIKNWGQLWFEKGHSERHSLSSDVNIFLKNGIQLTREVV